MTLQWGALQYDAYAKTLTFFVTADHPVPVEPREVPVRPEAEAVLRPLQNAALIDHPARQGDPRADDGRLILRLSREPLLHVRRRALKSEYGG